MTATDEIIVRSGGLREPAKDLVLGDRFRTEHILKQGCRVVTRMGVDLTRDESVVIKLLDRRAIGAGAQMRLEREARVMREINGPSCCGLTHFGEHDGLLYLVRPYCQGTTLQRRLADKPLDVRETLTLGQCLMTALHDAHRHGSLHLNITPANIVVGDQAPITQATLIDFGFSLCAQQEFSDHAPITAARYMSPEQAGLLDQDVDETADLYTAGVVLFECLAGRPLFEAATMGEVLRQHMTTPPPELRTLGLAVPRSLDEVIQRLLRKDPRDRYQSAAAVGADLVVIAEGLQRGESEPSIVIGLHDRRQTLTEPAFVGRDLELATLHDQLERSRQGQHRVVFLEADSGGGKSRLLLEFMLRCAQQGTWVLRGQGQDQAAQRPFEILAGVAAGLIADSRLKSDLSDTVRNALGDQLDAVCASLPELADAFHSTAVDIGPETFAETRSLHALSVLLDALGTAGRPVVVLLDDCQWADQLTLKVLRHWQRRYEAEEDAAQGGVLLVAAFRSEEVPAGHELRNLRPAAHLTLPEFQTSDIRQLVESMAGPLPDQVVDLIERLADGSPFMASAALRGLVESDALKAASDGWHVDEVAMSNAQSSRHAAAFLARRVELLPEPSIKLLSVGAVLGKEFDLFTAATLAAQSSGEAIAALDDARHRHIVWAKVQEGRCVFLHDKLRETLLDRLPEDDRRELHLRAALDLEVQSPQPVFELAYHFDAADQCERALPYALAAAEHARTRNSLDVAEQQYRIAQRGAQSADRATRFQIADGLGDLLMLLGRYDEAVRQTETARELAEGDVAVAQSEGKLGELAFKQGDMNTAIEALERALKRLRQKVPKWSAAFIFYLAREACVQVLHTWMPKLFVGNRRLKEAEKQLLVIRLHNRLMYAYWFGRGKVPTLWTHLRALNLAERYPATKELAQCYSNHAPVMSLLPLYDRGIAYAQKAFAIYKSLGDLWGQGQSLNFNGIVLYTASRFEESGEKCREAMRLLERAGDYWEVNVARYHVAASLYRSGDLAGAIVQAKKIHQSAVEIGDIQASGFSLDLWARSAGGQIPPDIVQTEIDRPRDDAQATAQAKLAQGVQLFYQDRVEEAAEVFEKTNQYTVAKGVRNAWVFPLLPWLASALRRQAEKTSCLEPERRIALLKRAGKAARDALRNARKFQNELPHALREAGLISAMQGSQRRARKYLDESLDVAERQGDKFEHAQSLLARGRTGLVLGWARAAEELTEARETLIEFGADFALDERPAQTAMSEPVTLSLADRFDTVLESGRQIASALTQESIYTQVREATLKLLRCEHCVVLQVNPENAYAATLVSEQNPGTFCPEMVCRALTDLRVIIYAKGTSEGVSEALLLSNVRSALCAPILVRGRPVACFYVTHHQVSDLFGEDERRLADFIATIAGAALENAEGFAQLQQLTETLEQRVQERTTALAASNEDLQQFAYSASHDLQEPLRSISGFCQLLQRRYAGRLDQEAEEWIQHAVQAAARMRALIEDLLTYARVDTQALPYKPVDLSAVVDEAITILANSISESGSCVTRDALPTVMGDRSQILQVLQNLVGNGIKFHDDKDRQVHVSAQCNGDVWTVAVRDNGLGIPANKLESIFEMFRRLHTQQEYPGTGIGLAICRRIVERHGGKIWVESVLGEGSTFFFTLRGREP